MSKALAATCVGSVVSVGGIPVSVATIFSKGVAQSSGVAFLDEDKAFYFANTAPDLETTLTQVVNALDQAVTAINKVADTLTAIGGGMTGPTTAPPPTLITNVAAITAATVQITTAKTALNTLKGSLK